MPVSPNDQFEFFCFSCRRMITEVNLGGGKSKSGSCMNCSRKATALFFGVDIDMSLCDPCKSRNLIVEAVHMVVEYDMTVRKCDNCFTRRVQTLKPMSTFGATATAEPPFRGYDPKADKPPPRPGPTPRVASLPKPPAIAPAVTQTEVDTVIKEIEESEGEMELCGCGKAKRHVGMCKVRAKIAADNKRIAEANGVKPKSSSAPTIRAHDVELQTLSHEDEAKVLARPIGHGNPAGNRVVNRELSKESFVDISTISGTAELIAVRDKLVVKRDAIQAKIDAVEKCIDLFVSEGE